MSGLQTVRDTAASFGWTETDLGAGVFIWRRRGRYVRVHTWPNGSITYLSHNGGKGKQYDHRTAGKAALAASELAR